MRSGSDREQRTAGEGRRRFLRRGVGAAAAVASALVYPAAERACCPAHVAAAQPSAPLSLAELAEGNAQAVAVARRSRSVMRTLEAVHELAAALPDPTVRERTLALLENPAPRVTGWSRR